MVKPAVGAFNPLVERALANFEPLAYGATEPSCELRKLQIIVWQAGYGLLMPSGFAAQMANPDRLLKELSEIPT